LQELRTEGAPECRNRDLAQTLRASLRGGIGWRLAASAPLIDHVHRHDDKEVNRRRDQHKRQEGVDEIADEKPAPIDGEDDRGEIGLADNRRDQFAPTSVVERSVRVSTPFMDYS
jgi:hypothetical protein